MYKKGFTLAEDAAHVYGSNNICRCAFTLAEVLITLGIIGVVAAMTMPTLINNTRNKELEAALKKNASVINQAMLRLANDEGIDINFAMFGYRQIKDKIKPYFNVIKDCGYGTEVSSCVPSDSYGGNADSGVSATYKNYSKTGNVNAGFLDDGQLLLSDGALILIQNDYDSNTSAKMITIDVNGYQKRPNAWGHDLFTFEITQNGIKPMGAYGTSYDEDTYCSKTSSSNLNGIACTAKALSDSNYFKNLP